MSQLTQSTLLVASLGGFLVLFWGIVAWTTWISFRLDKGMEINMKRVLLLALLQVVIGMGTVFLLRLIQNEPLLDLGGGLGALLLSGLFLMKGFFARSWKKTLRLWAVAVLMQFILLPVSGVALAFLLIMLLTVIFPPQL